MASVCLSVLDLLHRALHNQLFRRCNWLFDLFNGLGNTAILSSARNLRRITHRRYSSTLPGALFVREKAGKAVLKGVKDTVGVLVKKSGSILDI